MAVVAGEADRACALVRSRHKTLFVESKHVAPIVHGDDRHSSMSATQSKPAPHTRV